MLRLQSHDTILIAHGLFSHPAPAAMELQSSWPDRFPQTTENPYPTNPILFFRRYSIFSSFVCTETLGSDCSSCSGTLESTTAICALYLTLAGCTACSWMVGCLVSKYSSSSSSSAPPSP